MVVRNLLPGRPAVGLRDIQAERTEFLSQHERDSVDGSHHGAGFVFRQFPDVFGMSPRNDERVAASDLSFVQERDAVLVFIHAPRRQHAVKDFAERAVHRTMIPACPLTISRAAAKGC